MSDERPADWNANAEILLRLLERTARIERIEERLDTLVTLVREIKYAMVTRGAA